MGLRGRLVVALVATGAATLAVAALVAFPLLEQRLVDQRLGDLRDLARTVRPTLHALPRDDITDGSRALRDVAGDLAYRTGARIVVSGSDGRTLVDTTPTRSGDRGLRAARVAVPRRGGGVVSGTSGDTAYAGTAVDAGGDRVNVLIVKRLDEERAARSVLLAALPLAAPASLLVALALAFVLARGLLVRLERLRGDARALGDEGLAHSVDVRGEDEVAEVAAALEEMRGRLLEEETSRRAFLATASHELRTPVASLQATLELLREELGRAGRDPRRADLALRQTHRLTALATDLLDLSRIDDDAPLHPEPLELREVVDAVAHEFVAPLERDGRRLTVDGGPALVLADPSALARIVRILLDNARSHGAGRIALTVATTPGAVSLDVRDAGEGIAPDEREHVFVRFARGRAAAGGVGGPGFGLGLPIGRALARAMGGDLTVAEPACLRVTLPPWEGEEREDATAS